PSIVSTPTTAAGFHELGPMAGQDRPPRFNYMIAPDLPDMTGERVFAGFPGQPHAPHHGIIVVEALDGGVSWPRSARLNKVSTGRRFLPWICSDPNGSGTAFVGWYDRREGTGVGANPDLTAYFRSSVSDNGSAIAVGDEFNASGTSD